MPKVTRGFSSLKNILTREQTKILETSFILMLPALLTKVTGQLFNLILTSSYSATDSRVNQFFIANAIPELLTSVLMVGAVGTVVIPVLVASKSKDGQDQFYRVYSSILNVTVLIFIAISSILFVFAGQLIPAAITLIGSDIEPQQAEINNIVWMMRALILPQLILGISVFISTGLNVYDRYLLPQISPLFYNIGRIATILIVLPLIDKSPWAIVLSAYVGSILHLIIQIPLFIKLKIKYMFALDYKNPYIIEIAKLGLPRIVVLSSDQIGFLFNNFLGLAFIAGTSTLNYAKSLYLVIPSMFGYTFAYASYPTISRHFIDGNKKEVKYIANKTLNEIFFMALPFVVTLMVLRVPLVRLVYGIIPNTAFQLQDTYQVAWILLFFSFGLVFITARWFLFSMFYAAKDTMTPSIVSLFSLAGVVFFSYVFSNLLSYNRTFALSEVELTPGNGLWSIDSFLLFTSLGILIFILYKFSTFVVDFFVFKIKENLKLRLLSLALFVLSGIIVIFGLSQMDLTLFAHRSEIPNRAGIGGISLAMSLVYTVEFFFMILLFNKLKVNLSLRELGTTLAKKFTAAGAMLIFMYFIYKTWNALSYSIPETANITYRGSTTLNLFVLSFVTVVPAFMVYYLVCHLFRVEELRILRRYLNPVFRLGGLRIK